MGVLNKGCINLDVYGYKPTPSHFAESSLRKITFEKSHIFFIAAVYLAPNKDMDEKFNLLEILDSIHSTKCKA